jgi:hypothetical protein
MLQNRLQNRRREQQLNHSIRMIFAQAGNQCDRSISAAATSRGSPGALRRERRRRGADLICGMWMN